MINSIQIFFSVTSLEIGDLRAISFGHMSTTPDLIYTLNSTIVTIGFCCRPLIGNKKTWTIETGTEIL